MSIRLGPVALTHSPLNQPGERMLNWPLDTWKWISALLLVMGASGTYCSADSPNWADEEMLLPWPAALSGIPAAEDHKVTSVPWGHSSFNDAATSSPSDDDVQLAPWSVAQEAESDASSPIRPTSALDLFTHRRPAPKHPRPTPLTCTSCDDWHILPAGVLYQSYIAGEKEPRMAAAVLNDRNLGSIFEATLGGRLGLVRCGTPGPINPQGWQWDLEGAAMLRQNIEEDMDVEATDFRVGSVMTWRRGPTAAKAGYYHLSSHVGDEFLIRNPLFPRLNYVRDSVLIGVYHNLRTDLAIYGEIAYAFNTDGGAEPIELQFGVEYTPYDPTHTGGAPFFAVNGHLREEFDFGGSINVLAGWQWIGMNSQRRLRIGGQFYNGKEIQWSFFDESVQFVGVGIWYDF